MSNGIEMKKGKSTNTTNDKLSVMVSSSSSTGVDADRRSFVSTSSTPGSAADYSLREYMRSRSIFTADRFAIVVDGFRYVKAYKRLLQQNALRREEILSTPSAATDEDVTVLYFLSHFHSDHYTGISSTWSSGVIYCSEGTAAMVHGVLGVRKDYIFPMKVGCNYIGIIRGPGGAPESAASATHVFPLSDALVGEDTATPESRASLRACYEAVEEKRAALGFSHFFIVRLVSSNHCPGAVMFLFYSASFGYLLHTGDFRFNGKNSDRIGDAETAEDPEWDYEEFIEDNPYLQEAASQVDTLFLDNTFCSPAYHFPTQEEISKALIDLVYSKFIQHSYASTSSSFHVGVVIGSYVIGKERIALELQKAFTPPTTASSSPSLEHVGCIIPIIVSPSKYEMLKLLQFFTSHFTPWEAPSRGNASSGSTEEEPHRLSSSEEKPSTVLQPQQQMPLSFEGLTGMNYLSIYLVPMGAIGYKPLRDAIGHHQTSGYPTPTTRSGDQKPNLRLELESGVYLNLAPLDHIVAVEPTGFSKRIKKTTFGTRGTRISLPYSEHCSFDELLRFVQFINPHRIIPTVDVAQFKAHESLFLERAPRLCAQPGSTAPLSRLFETPSLPSRSQKKPSEVKTEDAIVGPAVPGFRPQNPFKRCGSRAAHAEAGEDVTEEPLRKQQRTQGVQADHGSPSSIKRNDSAVPGGPLAPVRMKKSLTTQTLETKRQMSTLDYIIKPKEDSSDCFDECVIVNSFKPTIVISDDDLP